MLVLVRATDDESPQPVTIGNERSKKRSQSRLAMKGARRGVCTYISTHISLRHGSRLVSPNVVFFFRTSGCRRAVLRPTVRFFVVGFFL